MENNNKNLPNFSRPFNSKNSQSADSKRKTDTQVNKFAFPRVPRRRDLQPTTNRSEQQRNSKQLPAKQRANVDKRPRARGGGTGGNGSNTYLAETGDADNIGDDAILATSTGLVDETTHEDDVGIDDYADFVDFDEVHFNGGHNSRTLNVSGKRKNLNHLLNFRCDSRESSDYFGRGGNHGLLNSYVRGGKGAVSKKYNNPHKYNKEQFLQANFQFVIKSSVKPQLFTSPDSIVDWSFIEQINIQTSEEPTCPICLYPPVAAKLTRCGHAYCWPCILHYLALNDKSWRKCPICYEAIHVRDLKSCAILQQCTLNVGDDVTFQLMRRKKGSFFVEKFSSAQTTSIERYPQYSGNSDIKVFSKFLLAKRSDILTIIERERAELMVDDDTSCAEYVFVEQALNLLKERREQLGEIQMFNKDEEEQQEPNNFTVSSSKLTSENNNEEKLNSKQFEVENSDEVCAVTALPNFDKQSACINGSVNLTQQQKYYYFYQSVDGQNIFLHPLNVKMLQACYGALEFAPLLITARILQKEYHTMDDELRRKFTCLGHLPLTCQFSIVEVDLQTPIVTIETLNLFKDDIKQRQLDRERRDREEMKREKKIAAINDRQMGKLIAKAANLNLASAQEFPVCGFGFDLSPPASSNLYDTTMLDKAETQLTEPIGGSASSNASGSPPDDIKQRQLDRERRDREEMKREKKIAAINDRQMGKLIAKAANLNLASAQEFPVCGFGFDLSPPASSNLYDTTMLDKAETQLTEPIGGSASSNASGSPPDDIKQRQLDRERRDREEMKREKKIAAINDRQMGKLIAKAANLNLASAQEFPVCGFGFDLSPPASSNLYDTTMLDKAETQLTEPIGGSASSNASGSPPGLSYSSILMSQKNPKANAANFFPELSMGAKVKKNNNVAHVNKAAISSSRALEPPTEILENDSGDTLKSLGTTFGDVMEQAIARKKANVSSGTAASSSDVNNSHNNASNCGGKKQKREKKKMVPLIF